MRLLTIVAVLFLSLIAALDAKPTFLSYKVVSVPVVIPKLNILGLVGKAVGIKAALLGKAIKAKKALVHHLLDSSSLPVPALGVVWPPPLPAVFPEPIYPPAPPVPPPPPPPSTSYGTPDFK